jgi:hypothetical protein
MLEEPFDRAQGSGPAPATGRLQGAQLRFQRADPRRSGIGGSPRFVGDPLQLGGVIGEGGGFPMQALDGGVRTLKLALRRLPGRLGVGGRALQSRGFVERPVGDALQFGQRLCAFFDLHAKLVAEILELENLDLGENQLLLQKREIAGGLRAGDGHASLLTADATVREAEFPDRQALGPR